MPHRMTMRRSSGVPVSNDASDSTSRPRNGALSSGSSALNCAPETTPPSLERAMRGQLL